MDTGKVIKSIRLSKKLKSKNVYSDILSRPARSRFEKGLSDTTSKKLFEILSNLNISLEEFYFTYNNYKIEDNHDFITQYSKYFYSNDIESLRKLEKSTIEKYWTTNQIKFCHYSALTSLTISSILEEKPNLKNVELLKEYLLNCEEWTYYELVLFTNSLDFFSEELLLLLYKHAKNKLEHFSLLRRYNNEVFSLLSNILVLFITKNNVSQSVFFYQELKNSVSETINKMYEKTMLIFFKELINIMNSTEYDDQNIVKIISLFNYLDMPFKRKQCISLVKVVKSNNPRTLI
ncbi:MAG: hypothetical protein KC455_08220 [Carnobacterium sp.]|nr:hypothetical protein [Carnobacterium sp.]